MISFRTLAAAASLLVLAACDAAGPDVAPQRANVGPAASAQPARTPVCHYHPGQDRYNRLDLAAGALAAHLAHGDPLFTPDVNDNDPTDGDRYCLSVSDSNAAG